MVVAVSSSPSSAAPSAGRTHPTYKEMVVQALTELRDPGGSSRHAIGKYIADHFTGLHSSHEELLSAHLRRLVSQGQLRLVSGNYFLSTEAPSPRRGPRPPAQAQGGCSGSGAEARPGTASQERRFGYLRSGSELPGAQARAWAPAEERACPSGFICFATAGSKCFAASIWGQEGAWTPAEERPCPGSFFCFTAAGSKCFADSIWCQAGAWTPTEECPCPSGFLCSAAAGCDCSAAIWAQARAWTPTEERPCPVSFLCSAAGAITPPPSEAKRGRGRPRKNALVPVASSSLPLPGGIARPSPSGVKRGRGRPRKNSYPVAVTSLPLGIVAVSSVSVVGAKRGRGRPPKAVVAGKRKRGRPPKEKKQPESVQSAGVPLVKRGPGRPRKEKTVESGHLNAAQMSEGRHEALPAQAVDQAGAVQIEVEAGSLQSFGTSLTEKRGRGRPRKRPLETEAAETGAAALSEKRGRGRPRKEDLSESGLTALTGIKRGRERPRKVRPFETGFAETAVEVYRDLTEVKPEKDEDLASGTKSETQDVILVEEMDALPADDGCVLVSGEEAAPAPMDAGGAMPEVVTGEEATIAPMDAGGAMPGVVSGEEAAVAPMDAGAAMPGVDPVESNLGTKSH